MRRHPLRNSPATLIEEGASLRVEAPDRQQFQVDMGVLSLTSRCNLDCIMCLEARGEGAVDLPFDEAMGFVELFAGRVPTIWSCAGEALLYPRFFEVAAAISRRGTRIGIGTNGTVLGNPEVVRRCADSGVRTLHVSCHTVRPGRFAAIAATDNPALFDGFVRGIRNLDDWNRDCAPDRRIEALLQLVLMEGFEEEIPEYLEFVARHLAHTPVRIRVEPMQPLNAALGHPELGLDLAAIGRIVRRLIDEYSERFTFEFKSIPLCMLTGSEGSSEDLRTRAAGTVVLGNLGRHSAGLQLQCAIGDPERSALAAYCAECTLLRLCPGVMNNPVPEGSPWPRVVSAPAAEILERWGLPTEFAARKFALEFPIHFAGMDAPPPSPPPDAGPGRDDDRGDFLTPDRLGVDEVSGQRFTSSQLGVIEGLLSALAGDEAVAETRLSERFAAVRLRGEKPPPGRSVVVLVPAGPSTPCLFSIGGIAVRYNGEMNGTLRDRLDRVRKILGAEAQ